MTEILDIILFIAWWVPVALAALLIVTALIGAHRNRIPFIASLVDTVRAFLGMAGR